MIKNKSFIQIFCISANVSQHTAHVSTYGKPIRGISKAAITIRRNIMNNIITKPNYISFTYARDLRNLCQPLFQGTNVDSFHYVRAYHDGGYISLNTDLKIEEFELFEGNGKFNHDVKILDSVFDNKKFSKSKYTNRIYLFTEDVDNGYWARVFKKFNVKTCFNIIEKYNDYYERFGFRSRFDKSPYSFYVNHYDVLERFVLYFKEHGINLIKAGEKNKAIWFNNNPKYNKLVQNLKETFSEEDNHIETLKARFRIRKYPINNSSIKSYLTPHELKCLQHFGQGFTYKEIGNILRISYRTVETHMRRIRDKLDIHSHSQLLKIYHSSALINL